MFLYYTYDYGACDAATGDAIALAVIGSDAGWPCALLFAAPQPAARPQD